MNSYWYVATPYSRYRHGLKKAYEHANQAAAALVRKYRLRVFCPIGHSHSLCSVYGTVNGIDDHVDPAFWKWFDEPFLRHAHGVAVIMMDGWDKSDGVLHEIEYAKYRKMPIRYYRFPHLTLAQQENEE